jgi:hypothetical protein
MSSGYPARRHAGRIIVSLRLLADSMLCKTCAGIEGDAPGKPQAVVSGSL